MGSAAIAASFGELAAGHIGRGDRRRLVDVARRQVAAAAAGVGTRRSRRADQTTRLPEWAVSVIRPSKNRTMAWTTKLTNQADERTAPSSDHQLARGVEAGLAAFSGGKGAARRPWAAGKLAQAVRFVRSRLSRAENCSAERERRPCRRREETEVVGGIAPQKRLLPVQ